MTHKPVQFQEYPKWLEHPAANPKTNQLPETLVYDADQEAYYKSCGYIAKGSPDAHAYLLSVATTKIDAAITSFHGVIIEKIDSYFRRLRGELDNRYAPKPPPRVATNRKVKRKTKVRR